MLSNLQAPESIKLLCTPSQYLLHAVLLSETHSPPPLVGKLQLILQDSSSAPPREAVLDSQVIVHPPSEFL